MNILIRVFLVNTHTYAFLLEVYLRVEFLSYDSVSIYLALVDNSKQFSKAAVLSYTPGSNYDSPKQSTASSTAKIYSNKENIYLHA